MRLSSVAHALAKTGQTIDVLVKVIEQVEADDERLAEEKRERDRARQRAYRAKRKAESVAKVATVADVTPVTRVTRDIRNAPAKPLETLQDFPPPQCDTGVVEGGTIGGENKDRPFFVDDDPLPPPSLEKRSGEKPKRKPRAPKPTLTRDLRDEFERFWREYPLRKGRGAAERKFEMARRDTEFDALMDGVRRYAEERKGEEARYTAHAATWLHQRRWLDEAPPTNVIPMMRQVVSRGDEVRQVVARMVAEKEAKNAGIAR